MFDAAPSPAAVTDTVIVSTWRCWTGVAVIPAGSPVTEAPVADPSISTLIGTISSPTHRNWFKAPLLINVVEVDVPNEFSGMSISLTKDSFGLTLIVPVWATSWQDAPVVETVKV